MTVTGGSKGTFTAVNDSSYTLVVTPTGSTNVDGLGGAGCGHGRRRTPGPASAETRHGDVGRGGALSVSIGGVTSKINSTDTLSVTFTWSKDVTGFVTGDVSRDRRIEGRVRRAAGRPTR